MSSFAALPVDAVDHLLTFLALPELESFSRVSKSLRHLSERHLYHEIRWNYTPKTKERVIPGPLELDPEIGDWRALVFPPEPENSDQRLEHALSLYIADHSYSPSNNPTEEQHQSQRDIRVFLSLFRTLVDRPGLARTVKRAVFDCYFDGWDDYDLYDFTISLPEEDKHCALRTMEQLDLDSKEFLRDAIDENSLDAMLALLLARLPNLEYLQLPFGFVNSFNHIGTLMNLAANCKGSQCPIFSHLKEVSFCPRPDVQVLRRDFCPQSELFLALFSMTSMEKIDVILPPLRDFGIHLWGDWSTTQNRVHTLILRHSEVSPSSLARVLKTVPRLETLQYDYDCDLDNLYASGYACEDDWGKLSRALKFVARTLKSLSISLDYHFLQDYKPDDWLPQESWEWRGRMDSLCFLEKLEYLEIPLPVLLGWVPEDSRRLEEVLPSSLRELALRDDLLDWGEYLWTPWDSFVIGSRLAESWNKTCEVEHVIVKLGGYLNWLKDGNSSLEGVTLMVAKDRIWPPARLQLFTFLCWHANIKAKVHARMGDERNEELQDLVKEITLFDPKQPAEEYPERIKTMPLRVFGEHC